MKKHLVIIGILALLVSVGLSGCSTQYNKGNQVNNTINIEKTKFVGTWTNTTDSIITTWNLFLNGTCQIRNYTGTWDVNDSKLVINILSTNYVSTYTYNYTFSNNRTLILISIGGYIPVIYTKQIS